MLSRPGSWDLGLAKLGSYHMQRESDIAFMDWFSNIRFAFRAVQLTEEQISGGKSESRSMYKSS